VPGAVAVGCNTEGQRQEFAELTVYDPEQPPGCSYEILADYLAPGVQITDKTTAFFNAFVERWGKYPMYIAGSYDALYSLMENVQEAAATLGVNDIADVVSPENIDVLIQTMEQSTHEGAAGLAGYFPLPIELEEPVTHPYYGIESRYVLSEEVVNELYPHLATYNMTYDPAWWTVPPHTAHCIIGGVGWSTGISSQWQEVEPGRWDKVAIWPAQLFDPDDYETEEEYWAAMMEAGWLNQWGNWNFSYPGSGELQIPDWWIAHHFLT